jgi:Ricin-type beta-trefoil lectin domain
VPQRGILRVTVLRIGRGAALGMLAAAMFGGGAAYAEAHGAPEGGAPEGAANIGPAQINAIGRPGLCWQANGNGAPITLEGCDSAIQAQQWSLTSNGVLMNGIGYCLEARNGQPGGVPLYIDFAGQCGGGPGQTWQFSGASGQFSSGGAGQPAGGATGICAAAGGPIAPGTEIVRRTCPAAGRGPRWSLGYSDVTVATGQGSGPAGGTFTAYVTVGNAASAQTAYGTAVRFALPRGLSAVGLHASGGAAALTCRVAALTCSGALPAGDSGRIDLAGVVARGALVGSAYTVSARASVAGTSQSPGARTRAPVAVTVLPAVPDLGGAPGSRSPGSSPVVPLIAILAGVLVVGGGLLIAVAKIFQALRAPDDDEPGAPPGHRGRGRHDERAGAGCAQL